jgi:prepilin signal peptidase PulO-like enzyme (type II secretory pathway)
VLVAVQASLVALPAAGLPGWARRFAGRSWWLVLPGSILLVIGLLAVLPGAADVLTWLALLAIPPLTAVALGWAMRGAHAAYALAAVAVLAVALSSVGTRAGELAAIALTALSCVTLGRLLAGAAPAPWLRGGLVVMAIVDAILVFSGGLDQPNATLIAAAPGPGLPQLQFLGLDGASMGYGDVFVAGVLGGVLAAEGVSWRVQSAAAAATLVAALAFDCLFAVTDTLPATVPVAFVTLLFGGLRGRRA